MSGGDESWTDSGGRKSSPRANPSRGPNSHQTKKRKKLVGVQVVDLASPSQTDQMTAHERITPTASACGTDKCNWAAGGPTSPPQTLNPLAAPVAHVAGAPRGSTPSFGRTRGTVLPRVNLGMQRGAVAYVPSLSLWQFTRHEPPQLPARWPSGSRRTSASSYF